MLTGICSRVCVWTYQRFQQELCTSSVCMVRLAIREHKHVRTEILSLFYPLLLLIVPQCMSRSKALFYIWRCVQSLQWGVSTSTSLQPGGPPLVGCPQLLVQYICSCPPYQKAVCLFELWRRAILWSVTFGEQRKLMSYNMSGCWRRERQGNRGLQQTA